jgi:outer membrane protein TolC
MRRIVLIILSFIFFQKVVSQEILTVDEAIAEALKKNYDILLVRKDSTAYSIDYNYAFTAFLPGVNANASKLWNKNDQSQEFTDGSKRSRKGIRSDNLAASVNLNWTLFDGFGMFATRQKLAEFVKLGELNVRNQVVNTVANVINNYYNIVQQKQLSRANQEQMSINEERVKLADRKLSVGLGAKPELLQAKVDLNAQKAELLKQLTLVDQLKEQLNQLIGRPLTDSYEVIDTIPINLNLQLGNILTDIERSSPGLQIARKNIDIAGLTLKERRSERWPTIAFTSAYNFSRINNQVVVNPIAQALFSMNKGFNFGFSATIPLLNGLTTRRQIQQAELDIEYQHLFFESQLSILEVKINNSFKDYEYQKRALILEEENISLARENLMIAFERFRQGVSTFLELREAQKSLLEGNYRLIAARYNTKVAETELLRLKGELVR